MFESWGDKVQKYEEMTRGNPNAFLFENPLDTIIVSLENIGIVGIFDIAIISFIIFLLLKKQQWIR